MTTTAQEDTSPADTTNAILTVGRVSRDGGDYVVKCPHCQEIIGIQGEDLSEVRGEQFQHRRREYPGPRGSKTVGCDGWLEVSHSATFVREL